VVVNTNHLERALRAIPMGRRNWLLSWIKLGAKHVGIVQSLIVTCRLHQINPYDYLGDVLQRMDEHPAARVAERTHDCGNGTSPPIPCAWPCMTLALTTRTSAGYRLRLCWCVIAHRPRVRPA
jgi:hypothetical protein